MLSSRDKGFIDLRNAIYYQACRDWKYLRYRRECEAFLLSGAYHMSPEMGEYILKKLERGDTARGQRK